MAGGGTTFASVCLSKLDRLKAILIRHKVSCESEIKADESHLDFLLNVKSGLATSISTKISFRNQHTPSATRLTTMRQQNSHPYNSSLERRSPKQEAFRKKLSTYTVTSLNLAYHHQIISTTANSARVLDHINPRPKGHLTSRTDRSPKCNYDIGDSWRFSDVIHCKDLENPKLLLNKNLIKRRNNSNGQDDFIAITSSKNLASFTDRKHKQPLTDRYQRNSKIFFETLEPAEAKPPRTIREVSSDQYRPSRAHPLNQPKRPYDIKNTPPSKTDSRHHASPEDMPQTPAGINIPSFDSLPHDQALISLKESPILMRRTVIQANNYKLQLPHNFDT